MIKRRGKKSKTHLLNNKALNVIMAGKMEA